MLFKQFIKKKKNSLFFRSVGRSYSCGSLWKGSVWSILHNHVPLHGRTLSNSCAVSHQQCNGATDHHHPVHLLCCDHIYVCTSLYQFPRFFFFYFRQNGVGYTALIARLGVSMSPLIMLLEDVWHLLPAVTYCAVAVGCGLVASLLPETLNARLPETIEDIEKPRKREIVLTEDVR